MCGQSPYGCVFLVWMKPFVNTLLNISWGFTQKKKKKTQMVSIHGCIKHQINHCELGGFHTYMFFIFRDKKCKWNPYTTSHSVHACDTFLMKANKCTYTHLLFSFSQLFPLWHTHTHRNTQSCAPCCYLSSCLSASPLWLVFRSSVFEVFVTVQMMIIGELYSHLITDIMN